MAFLKNFYLFAILIGLAAGVQAQSFQSKLDSLDTYFQRTHQQWQVPGLAVGIVKDDSLVFAKGYGLRNIKEKAAVDAQTIFPVASNTKAFTATAMAILVDEGKISWDTKVVDILPYFAMYNDYVSQHLTIADMLSHRSGLVTFSGDLLWYGTDYTREDVVKKLPMLTPQHDFRTEFGYSNILYIAAGEVIAKVSGMSYDEFIQKRIFEPLGMTSSYTSINELENIDNVCSPHNKINDKVFPIALQNWDNIGGAGVINSNVEDMSQWLRLQLKRGQWDGQEIYSARQSVEMWTPHTNFMVTPAYQRMWPSTHFRSYGLGWSLSDYHGKMVVNHSGGYDGVITFTCLVPEENIGFVILTNSNSSLYNALSYKILDVLLSTDSKDWSALFLPYQQNGDMREPIAIRENALDPSLKIKQYEGLYQSAIYGNALVTAKGKKLKIKLLHTAMWDGNVTTFDKDTFIIEFEKVPSLPQGYVYFTVKEGEVEKFVIDVPNPDFDFTEFTFKKMPWVALPEEEK